MAKKAHIQAYANDPRTSKENARRRPLEVIRTESNLLWNYLERKTRCKWLELAGTEAPTCDLLVQEQALGNTFIGLDLQLDGTPIIEGCLAKYADLVATDKAVFIHVNMLNLIRDDHPLIREVGVLVFDTNRGLGSRNLDDPEDDLVLEVTDLIKFGKKQQKRLGEFVLVLNITQQHAKTSNRERWPVVLAEKLVEAKVLFPEDVERVRINPECLVGKYPCLGSDEMLFSLIRFGFGQVLCAKGNPLGLTS